jgi:hypothetical protein
MKGGMHPMQELQEPTDEARQQELEDFDFERRIKNIELFARQTNGWGRE